MIIIIIIVILIIVIIIRFCLYLPPVKLDLKIYPAFKKV